jgi:hypothetical protein
MLSMPKMQKDRLRYSRTGHVRSNHSACRDNEGAKNYFYAGHDEIDSNITRPRTQDDVIREILSSQPSDKHTPVPPRKTR